MDKLRIVALIAALVAAMALVAGCGGGQTTHEIDSPWYGDLFGVETSPENNDTNVPLNAWIEVYWPHEGYPPPAIFTVKLQKEQNPGVWGDINTVQDDAKSDPANGIWWFLPSSQFSPFTWYRIVIKEDGTQRTAIAYFRTDDWLEAAALAAQGKESTPGKKYRPQGAGSTPAPTGPGAIEHKIKVNR